MTPNGCQTVKGSLSASLSLWAWVLCGLGLQMTWREALTLLCPCWGLSLVICIPLLLTFSFPAVLNGLLLQLPWQLALPMLFSLTGAVGTPVLGIQGSDPRIQPIADGVDFSIQCGLNLYVEPVDRASSDSGIHRRSWCLSSWGYQGNLHFRLFFQAGFPQGCIL